MFLFFFTWLMATFLLAWENHVLPTTLAVSNMPEISKAKKIHPESLENFLKATGSRLEKVLRQEEQWARQHVLNYPPRCCVRNDNSRAWFLKTIRVNPNIKLLLPKAKQVSAASVFIRATDEPDDGLDIGLWADNDTDFGREYLFGNQPFGDPRLDFGSQAPFHMGFYHEWRLMYLVASDLQRTLPEYRIHLFYTLARFAFQTGHPYWGWRFAGWGAHYIQDLTQPYHTTLLPGTHTAWLIFCGLLDKIGIHGPKLKLVQEASDKHLAFEKNANQEILSNVLIRDVLEQQQAETLVYTPDYVRQNLTLESHEMADHMVLLTLMQNFRKHTRAWLRAVLSASD